MILRNFSEQALLTALAPLSPHTNKKIITWPTKQTNTRQGTNILLCNFNLFIVNLEHDISCWVRG